MKLLVPEMHGKINCGMSAVNCTVHLKLQAPEMHGKCGMSAVNCAVHLKLQAPEMHGKCVYNAGREQCSACEVAGT